MKRVLVIGEGQLGTMLAEAAARLGIALDRVAPDTELLYRGTSAQPQVLDPGWRGEEYDLITVEREHLGTSPLMAKLRSHLGFLNRSALFELADRRRQKALLDRLGVATAQWQAIEQIDEVEVARCALGGSVVVKTAVGGYDGRGHWYVSDGGGPGKAIGSAGALVVERKVSFARELSLIGARGAAGECVFLPLAENHHVEGMLRCSVVPAQIEPRQQRHAEDMLRGLMEHLDYRGVMAMELFEEKDTLLVNEIAPRVHNSGHWSQNGCDVDQFELHLRAICGWPLGRPRCRGHSVMLNLIGRSFDSALLNHASVFLHWYGKDLRARRKQGHLNLCESDADLLARALGELLDTLDAEHVAAIEHARGILLASAAMRAREARPTPVSDSAPDTLAAGGAWSQSLSGHAVA